MIWWSVFNFTKHVVWLEKKRSFAAQAVKEATRNAQVIGVENHKIVGEREKMYASLDEFSKECAKLNLQATYQQVFALLVKVGNPFAECYWSDVENDLKGIQWALDKELLNVRLALVPSGKSQFFERDDGDALFGKEVYNKFKSARLDIKNAGNCLAIGLESAAVFHLMRVTEVGLHALAKELGVAAIGKRNIPIEYRTWGEIIAHIQQNMTVLVQGTSEFEKRERSQFYHGVLIQCEAIKELWRNPVSHSGKHYAESEALSAFTHVKEFMTLLAKALRKKP